MRKWIAILLLMFPLWACVGQKEDPEPDPDPVVPVDPGGEDEGKVFFHRVLAMGFTATWCQYCPEMSAALSEAYKERPGRIVTLAVHYMDELSSAEENQLLDKFHINAFPSLVFDCDLGTSSSGRPAETLVEYVDRTVGKAACGIAAECSISNGKLNVSATIKAVRSASYNVCAALIEDGVKVANQAGYGPSYVCNAVLRGYLGPGIDGFTLGKLQARKEGVARFSAAAPKAPDNMRVVIYVLEDGIVTNTLSLGLNEKIEYTYEKED